MHPDRKEQMERPIHIEVDGASMCGGEGGSLVSDMFESECDACAKCINEIDNGLQTVSLMQIQSELTYCSYPNPPSPHIIAQALRRWLIKHTDQIVESFTVVENYIIIIHRKGRKS